MLFDYRIKVEQENFGSISLHVESLANLDEAIDTFFGLFNGKQSDAEIEALCPYFGLVWPSARGLSEYLVDLGRPSLEGARVLEVGCGLAVPSMVAAKLGAQGVATDLHPDIPHFLQRNLKNNQIESVTFRHLNWTASSLPAEMAEEKFEWVIGSDILYEKQQPAPLAAALDRFCSSTGTVVVADPGRPYLQVFSDEMKRLGFTSRMICKKVRDCPVEKDIFVLEFKRVTSRV